MSQEMICCRCRRAGPVTDSGIPEGWTAVILDEFDQPSRDVICSGCSDDHHLVPLEGEAAFLNAEGGATFHLVINAKADPEKGVGLGSGTWWTIEQGSREDGSLNSFGFDSLEFAIEFLEDEFRRYEKGGTVMHRLVAFVNESAKQMSSEHRSTLQNLVIDLAELEDRELDVIAQQALQAIVASHNLILLRGEA
jgi:hypothetical protein